MMGYVKSLAVIMLMFAALMLIGEIVNEIEDKRKKK